MSEPGSWALTWGNRSWSEDDLTGAHAALVAIVAGRDTWTLLDPFAGPVALMQLLAACISLDEQRDILEVMGELGRTPIKQLLSVVTIE